MQIGLHGPLRRFTALATAFPPPCPWPRRTSYTPRVFEVRVHDIDRLRVARGQPGEALAWSTMPWFSNVRAVAGLADGTVAVGGDAGLTRLSADLRRCLGRDDSEPLTDLQRGAPGLLGAGTQHVCLWPSPDKPALRWEPSAFGLYGPPRRVRWHPDQRRAAIVDERGQIVVVAVQRGEVRPEAIVGDFDHVDGVTWHPSGRTLVIAGADKSGARLWAWTPEDGTSDIALPTARLSVACAVAFHPRTRAMHVVLGRQRLAQGGWGEPLVPLGEPSAWPTDGRLLEFTSEDGVLVGTAGDGLHVWDRGAHTWYHPGISLRIHCDDPCFAIAGDRLLLGTSEGLLVSTALTSVGRPNRSGAEVFSWGVPRLATAEGAVDIAPDGSALALANGYDRITVWSLAREARPVTVRTWAHADVHHEWDPSGAALKIFRGVEQVAEWSRLDRGEGDPGSTLPPDDPDPPGDPAHGWQLAELAADALVLRDPQGGLHPQPLPGLRQLLGAAWARNGDLIIVGASETGP